MSVSKREESTQQESLLHHDAEDFVRPATKHRMTTVFQIIILFGSVTASLALGYFLGQAKDIATAKFGLPSNSDLLKLYVVSLTF